MNRRGFLQSLIAGAGLVVLPTAALSAIKTVAPELFYLRGDGVADDTLALQAFFDGKTVIGPDGKILAPVVSQGVTTIYLPKGRYSIGPSIMFNRPSQVIDTQETLSSRKLISRFIAS